jgi:hypothetical protein
VTTATDACTLIVQRMRSSGDIGESDEYENVRVADSLDAIRGIEGAGTASRTKNDSKGACRGCVYGSFFATDACTLIVQRMRSSGDIGESDEYENVRVARLPGHSEPNPEGKGWRNAPSTPP